MPLHGLSERAVEDPPADVQDQVALLGHSDEFAGPDDAARGVLPAQEGFEPGYLARGDVDDGLVMEDELVGGDRALERGCQGVARDHRSGHLRLEERNPVLASRLGRIHRDVGVAQQLVR